MTAPMRLCVTIAAFIAYILVALGSDNPEPPR